MNVDDLPFVPAANYGGPFGPDEPSLIMIHSAETEETFTAAEGVANYFAGGSVGASTHLTADTNSGVLCVPLNRRCYGAGEGPSNAIAWQIELAGRAAQDRGEWLDDYSRAELVIVAELCKDLMRREPRIQPVHLTGDQLRAGERWGFTGHGDAHVAWPEGDYRSDPGWDFPWDVFLSMLTGVPTPDQVREYLDLLARLSRLRSVMGMEMYVGPRTGWTGNGAIVWLDGRIVHDFGDQNPNPDGIPEVAAIWHDSLKRPDVAVASPIPIHFIDGATMEQLFWSGKWASTPPSAIDIAHAVAAELGPLGTGSPLDLAAIEKAAENAVRKVAADAATP